MKNQDIRKKLRSLWGDRRSYFKRLLIIAPVMLAACFTFIFYGPMEMVAFGGTSMSYSYKDIIWLLAGSGAVIFAVLSAIIACLRGKIFNYVCTLVFSLTLCGYLQAALMNGELGILNGEAVAWNDKAKVMLINLGVWALVTALVFFTMYLSRKVWKNALMFVSLLLVVMQLVPMIGIFTGAYADAREDEMVNYSLTVEDMYSYSNGKNIFVFVLDYMDYDYIEQVLASEPEFLDRLDGFTGYTDATPVFCRTQPALNNILTGCTDLAFDVEPAEFYTESWNDKETNILEALDAQDYKIDLYANIRYLFGEPDTPTQYVSNVSDGKGEMVITTALRKLLTLSAYRYAPTALKPFFWADTNYFNEDMFESAEYYTYYVDDAVVAKNVAAATAEGGKNNFKFYHMYGSHPPYTLNADGTRSSTPTDVVTQTKGVFNILFNAFTRMKELGVYDDATIIITADHGDAGKALGDDPKPMQIGLFYKPSGSAGTPLTWSDAQVSSANIAPTIVKAAGADYSEFGTPLDEVAGDKTVKRVFYRSIMEGSGWLDKSIQEYKIYGPSDDLTKWRLTDSYDVKYKFYG